MTSAEHIEDTDSITAVEEMCESELANQTAESDAQHSQTPLCEDGSFSPSPSDEDECGEEVDESDEPFDEVAQAVKGIYITSHV